MEEAAAVVVVAPPPPPRQLQRKDDCAAAAAAAAEDAPLRVAQDLACALAGKKMRYEERVPARAMRRRAPGDGDEDGGDE